MFKKYEYFHKVQMIVLYNNILTSKTDMPNKKNSQLIYNNNNVFFESTVLYINTLYNTKVTIILKLHFKNNDKKFYIRFASNALFFKQVKINHRI